MQLAWRHKDRGGKERAREAAWHTDRASRLILASKNAQSQLWLCCWVNWRRSPVQIHTAQHDNEELCRSSPAAWLAHSKHFACYPPNLEFCHSWKTLLISFSGKHKQASLKTLRWPFSRDRSRQSLTSVSILHWWGNPCEFFRLMKFRGQREIRRSQYAYTAAPSA